MTGSRTAHRTPGWWAAAVLGGAVALGYVLGWLDQGDADPKSAYFVLTMVVGMVVGLWAWAWRPKTRMGPLMFWWPLLWLASDLLPRTRHPPLRPRSAWRSSSWARSPSGRWPSRIRSGHSCPAVSPGCTSSSSATPRRSSRTSTTSCTWRAARSARHRTSRRRSRSTEPRRSRSRPGTTRGSSS